MSSDFLFQKCTVSNNFISPRPQFSKMADTGNIEAPESSSSTPFTNWPKTSAPKKGVVGSNLKLVKFYPNICAFVDVA